MDEGFLVGKVGAVFTSAGTQRGGQETTLFSMLTTMLHHGMVVTGLPYSLRERRTLDEIAGGSPFDATTIAGRDDARAVSGIEKSGARFLGGTVAALALKLGAPR